MGVGGGVGFVIDEGGRKAGKKRRGRLRRVFELGAARDCCGCGWEREVIREPWGDVLVVVREGEVESGGVVPPWEKRVGRTRGKREDDDGDDDGDVDKSGGMHWGMGRSRAGTGLRRGRRGCTGEEFGKGGKEDEGAVTVAGGNGGRGCGHDVDVDGYDEYCKGEEYECDGEADTDMGGGGGVYII